MSKHCRHYDWVQGDVQKGDIGRPKCAVGIDLSGAGAARKCWPRPEAPCDKREEYTAAEIAAEEAESDALMKRTFLCLKAIPPKLPKRESYGTHGTVKCPACADGTIEWLRSSYNGHLHARCTTDGCFAVMQ